MGVALKECGETFICQLILRRRLSEAIQANLWNSISEHLQKGLAGKKKIDPPPDLYGGSDDGRHIKCRSSSAGKRTSFSSGHLKSW